MDRFKLIIRLAFIIAAMVSVEAKAQQHIYPPEEALWEADSLGNHRAVISVDRNVSQVTVAIEWRNRNITEEQMVYVVDSNSQELIQEVMVHEMKPERGVITFQPTSGQGQYYIYYMPYKMVGRRNYPNVSYKKQDENSSKNQGEYQLSDSKTARLIRLESVDAFNSNDPMERIASQKEVEGFEQRYKGESYLVIPEKRSYPIKMTDNLPERWMAKDLSFAIKEEVKLDENFTFQLGVWAKNQALNDIEITFSDLKSTNGEVLSRELFTCFNQEGIDYTGKKFSKTINIEKGKIQALWCGLKIPTDIRADSYSGLITLNPQNGQKVEVPITLTVLDTKSQNGGIEEPWKQTRLNWLNSTLAQENTVIAPYTPLEVEGNALSLLGRKVILAQSGLPFQVQSFFTEEMTSISETPKELLTAPFDLKLIKEGGAEIPLSFSGVRLLTKEAGEVTWTAKGLSSAVQMEVNGKLEFDGFMNYEIKVTALEDIALDDIALEVPLTMESSKYILGLGQKGAKRPEKVEWKWDVTHKNQDGWWLGDVNGGLQMSLRDQHYERPLNTNFYLQKPLALPISWGNGDLGGIQIKEEDQAVKVLNYSGARKMKAGDTLYYNFTLLITPFHPLQTDAQWSERYFHAYQPVDSVKASGANIINIHHANEINPYINYPFIATKEMKAYVDEAHGKDLKVKIYNTVREVSNRLYELYPLMSLNHEVFSAGNGGGYSWLEEHLEGDYIAAWYVPHLQDAAIINSGMNRWHNYYVEGMNWLVQNIGIDGIYLDDVAFDRITMKRIKRVLTKQGHPGLIDLHSANQYNERDGYNNSAHLYMEHFPYINRLWFGEYFDYEKESPDFYMTEVSGIPFGLMGEMLQDGGNPWRGMLYGMTNRMPYQEQKPDHIWKAWDDFGMQGSQMIGYWVSDCPVVTDHQKVLATVFKQDGRALVSLASWADTAVDIQLDIDWDSLGIDPKKAKITAPEILGFQEGRTFDIAEKISVQKNEGWMLIIEER
ncbi:hypothetical protein GCM10007049_03610 [Echinicola pacifica]|uniref:Glycoside hydrolase 123-like N-terminal domain-containing protein n=1 Tax=Echinicola pacifica TaxID=346377 RepID=A0A918PNE6_9BACT|nr:glycoside hydrolase domain-containing protein [Echinicola pacifica]GGZ14883.1 hypothetical protein GCM10007049_03610 [Echinicola pacifica]